MTRPRRILTAGLVVAGLVLLTVTLSGTRPSLPPEPRSLPFWCERPCPPPGAPPAFLPGPTPGARCWGADDRAYALGPGGVWVPSAARNPIDSATYPDLSLIHI